jgi:hypothetical protein
VAEFRAFWGEKAETRRFKDGAIREAVQWAQPDETPLERSRILSRQPPPPLPSFVLFFFFFFLLHRPPAPALLTARP